MTSTSIDGIHFLLGRDIRGNEWVSQYTTSEMAELFTEEQLVGLARGDVAICYHQPRLPTEATLFQDMVAATRAARD